MEFAEKFSSPVGLVFIDGDHSYESVRNDFLAWFPKVVNGGIMAFDDSIGSNGPRRVVRHYIYLSKHFKNVNFIGSLTWGYKVEQNSFFDRFKNICTLARKGVA